VGTPVTSRSLRVLARWWEVVLLGVLTVGAYGLVMYSFGVLIGPIHDATGWPVGGLSLAYTMSALLGGLGAPLSGWLLDRFGPRPVIAGSLVLGSGGLLAAASAPSLPLFVLAWGIGGGIVSAGLYYSVSMAVTARLFVEQRLRAFAILTFIGGLASVVFFPIAGLLVEQLSWRTALRVLVALMALHCLPAALLVRRGRSAAGGRVAFWSGLGEALRLREARWMIGMFALAGLSVSAVQVHQVPAMTAGGISLAAATTIASVKGLLSLPGRAGTEAVVRRAGVPAALGAAYAAMAAGTLMLAFGGLGAALAFMTVTGLAFGTISPLQGLFAANVYGERRLGTLLGVQTFLVSMAGAGGPVVLGAAVDATGGYRAGIIASALLAGMALLLLVTRPRSPQPAADDSGVSDESPSGSSGAATSSSLASNRLPGLRRARK